MVRNASILETKKFVALSYTYYKLLFKKHYSGYVVSWKLKIFNFFLIYTQTCKSTIVEHAQFLTITFVQYLPKTVSSVILFFFFILCALVHLFLNQPAMSNNPCFTSESIVLERKKKYHCICLVKFAVTVIEQQLLYLMKYEFHCVITVFIALIANPLMKVIQIIHVRDCIGS